MNYLFLLAILGIFIPPAIVPSIILLSRMDLLSSTVGLSVFYVANFLPFAIFFMTGFVKTIPLELEEAARIDGSNTLTIFLHIVLPLLKPIFATTAVVLVALMWNDFFFPLFLVTSAGDSTLVLALYSFVGGAPA